MIIRLPLVLCKLRRYLRCTALFQFIVQFSVVWPLSTLQHRPQTFARTGTRSAIVQNELKSDTHPDRMAMDLTHRSCPSPHRVEHDIVARSDTTTIAQHGPDWFVRDVKLVAFETCNENPRRVTPYGRDESTRSAIRDLTQEDDDS